MKKLTLLFAVLFMAFHMNAPDGFFSIPFMLKAEQMVGCNQSK